MRHNLRMPSVFKPLMPLDEAWRRLEAALRQGEGFGPRSDHIEHVPTARALERVLARDVVSAVDVPPHDNSAMDGYAVRVADLRLDAAGATVALVPSQRIAAGQVGEVLAAGSCARIFTGAPVPSGADAVVMQEQVEVEQDGRIRFSQPVARGQNIRLRGEDIAAGQVVLRAGTLLGPAALGVAASVGAAELAVRARPRVGILTTGDELVMPGQPLPPGAIYNSNRHTLMALGEACRADVRDLGLVPDQLLVTRQALRAAAEACDLVVTSGGVSVGEEDHLRQAVEAEGSLDFWALAIKPGKPFVFGRLRRTDGSHALYMGLPGNPSASWVTFLLLARPVISWLAGLGWHVPQALPLTADFSWPRPDKRREFLRARVGPCGRVEIHPHQGSGVLTSAAWADGLVDVAPGMTVEPGQTVSYLPLAWLIQPPAMGRQPLSSPEEPT